MLRLTLVLDPETTPLRGSVAPEDEEPRTFTGLLELLSVLEAAVDGAASADPGR